MCRCTVYLGMCDLISLWKKKLEKETYSMYPLECFLCLQNSEDIHTDTSEN